MKKIVLSLAFLGTSILLFSQGNPGNNPSDSITKEKTHWRLNGNMATENDFIGTKNEMPLIFKVDNIEHVRIEPETGVRFPQTKAVNASSEYRVMVMTADGNIKMLNAGQLHDLTALDGLHEPIDAGDYFICDPNRLNEDEYAPEWLYFPSNPSEGKLARIVTRQPDCNFTAVGINTTNPQAKLQVVGEGSDDIVLSVARGNSENDVFRVYGNGVVYTTEVNIKVTEDFPDYVFKEGYELIPLADLEKFIQENGHLPNIPKAIIIKEDGLSVGEMQVKQMEKIEELTLYTIEQDKQLKAQNELIKQQQELLKQMQAELQEMKAQLNKD